MKGIRITSILAASFAVCGLLSACATVPDAPPSPPVEVLPGWEEYRPAAPKTESGWGRPGPSDDRASPLASAIERAPLSAPAMDRMAAPAAAEFPGSEAPGTGSRPAQARREVSSAWADGHVEEGFRSEFDAAVIRAADRGLAEAEEPETGRVYAFTRKDGNEGCATVEVTVLSPGRTLPVLSRGIAETCRR